MGILPDRRLARILSHGSLTLALGMRPDEHEHTMYSAMKYYLSTFELQLDPAIRATSTGADLKAIASLCLAVLTV
jgi:hypothetical protein